MKDDPRQFSYSSLDRDSRCPEFRFLWFSAVPQDILTGVVNEAESVSVSRFPVYSSLHPFIQLLNCWQHPSIDLKFLYFYAFPPFFCPLFLPSNLSHSICSLHSSLRVTLYIPPPPHFSIHFVFCIVPGS